MFDNLFWKVSLLCRFFFRKIECKQPKFEMSTKLQYRLRIRKNTENPMGKCLKIDIERVCWNQIKEKVIPFHSNILPRLMKNAIETLLLILIDETFLFVCLQWCYTESIVCRIHYLINLTDGFVVITTDIIENFY